MNGLKAYLIATGLPYRCPYCVDRGIDPCEHGRTNGLTQDMKPLGEFGHRTQEGRGA